MWSAGETTILEAENANKGSVVIGCHEWSSYLDDKKLMLLSNFRIKISQVYHPIDPSKYELCLTKYL